MTTAGSAVAKPDDEIATGSVDDHVPLRPALGLSGVLAPDGSAKRNAYVGIAHQPDGSRIMDRVGEQGKYGLLG